MKKKSPYNTLFSNFFTGTKYCLFISVMVFLLIFFFFTLASSEWGLLTKVRYSGIRTLESRFYIPIALLSLSAIYGIIYSIFKYYLKSPSTLIWSWLVVCISLVLSIVALFITNILPNIISQLSLLVLGPYNRFYHLHEQTILLFPNPYTLVFFTIILCVAYFLVILPITHYLLNSR